MKQLLVIFLALAGCGDNTTESQKLPIGSACKASSDCGTGRYFCDDDHPNGYCKLPCHKDTECPSGSICAGAGTVAPGECHKVCNAAADCRTSEGYECKMAPDDATHAYCDVPEMEMTDAGAD